MSSRDAILARLGRHSATAWPAKTQETAERGEPEFLIERFAALANDTQMTVEQITASNTLPDRVASYLAREQLDTNIVLQAGLALDKQAWEAAGLCVERAEVSADNDVYVGMGLAVVADCGALVIGTGSGESLKSEFLTRTHIAVVNAQHVMPDLGTLWVYLQATYQARLPREFCLVTGPSRTADLGVPAKLGAHGPERVHVIISSEDP